jgi:pimeloyl-ACP methyl ester carboxylesterase
VSHISQQSSALMIELLEALSDRVQAIAIDYPSCGMSDHVYTQPTIEDYAQCVMAAMDAARGQRATALGEATGAFVSAALAAAYPERIDRAVLVNCPYYPDRGVSETAHASLRAGLRPSDASGFPVTRTLLRHVEPRQPHCRADTRVHGVMRRVSHCRRMALAQVPVVCSHRTPQT